MKFSYSILLCVAAALLLSACASGPNPKIEDARTTLQRSESNPDVARAAPQALREAKKNISRAQSAYDAGDESAADHYAYLAKTQLKMASAQAEGSRLQKQVESANAKRKQLELRAQQEKAISAQQSAADAQKQAQASRQQAEASRQQAAKLENELRALQAKHTKRGIVLTLGDVLFDTAKSNLKPGGLRTVGKLADFMNEYPERRVRIEGHTDSRGTTEYNQDLSQRRALSVKSALIQQGIDPSRITSVGLGEAYPKASNSTSAGRQQNRRVEIIISDENGKIKNRSDAY